MCRTTSHEYATTLPNYHIYGYSTTEKSRNACVFQPEPSSVSKLAFAKLCHTNSILFDELAVRSFALFFTEASIWLCASFAIFNFRLAIYAVNFYSSVSTQYLFLYISVLYSTKMITNFSMIRKHYLLKFTDIFLTVQIKTN